MQEDNLRAALLLEQAALFQLHTSPPLLRKFAFHTVLAGLRYNNCKQQRLGTHAYKCAPLTSWQSIAEASWPLSRVSTRSVVRLSLHACMFCAALQRLLLGQPCM